MSRPSRPLPSKLSPNLPPGLDPYTAGKWGLWLMGQRQHKKALRRTSSPRIHIPRGLADATLNLLVPWQVWEYPGRIRVLASLLNLSPATARRYASGDRPLPAKHALRLAEYLEADCERIKALIEEARAIVRASTTPEDRCRQMTRDRMRRRLERVRAAEAAERERAESTD